jgi:hypothetical protein
MRWYDRPHEGAQATEVMAKVEDAAAPVLDSAVSVGPAVVVWEKEVVPEVVLVAVFAAEERVSRVVDRRALSWIIYSSC